MSHPKVQAKQIECATRNAGANDRFDSDTIMSDWNDCLFRHFFAKTGLFQPRGDDTVMNDRIKMKSIIKILLIGTEKGDGYEKKISEHCKNVLITERIGRGLRNFPFHRRIFFSSDRQVFLVSWTAYEGKSGNYSNGLSVRE